MKLTALLLISAATFVTATAANAAPVEVRLSAPLGSNAYGQLVIGAPTYAQQVYVEPVVIYAPIDHQRHWHRWCDHYSACGQPVRFIEVHEYYRGDDHGHHHKHHHKHGRGHGHGRD